MRWPLLVLATGCTAQQGTISLGLTEAPGTTLLASVQRLHVTATSPHTELDVARGSTGFDLAFDLAADGTTGALLVDGFDGSDALVATGASPPFPIAAIDATVVIYMAPPRSLLAAPVALAAPASELATGALSYGAIFAGGRDAAGAATGAVSIYNAFDHTLAAGMPMPAARTGQALGVGAAGLVYLFGGSDATGAPTGSLWRFDTTVAPNGGYSDLGDHPELARTGQRMVATGTDEQVVTGAPVFQLVALGTTIAQRTQPASLPAAGAGLTTQDGVPSALFAEGNQLVRFRGDVVDTLPATLPADPQVVAMPPNDFVIAGSDALLVRVDGTTGAVQGAPAIPTPRKDAALGATSRYIIVAGGSTANGTLLGDALVFDATLALVATLPMVVPRTKAAAVPLPNGQLLIVGGVDAAGAPIATIELFTPESPGSH